MFHILIQLISHDNSFKEIKELMNTNNASLSNFIKKRKNEFCKYKTRNQLLNIYDDCLVCVSLESFDKT